jgi:hypothetical protein
VGEGRELIEVNFLLLFRLFNFELGIAPCWGRVIKKVITILMGMIANIAETAK